MNKLLIICGPTATGKTKLALKLARKFNGELISADSRQVYKGMDIGTGKDIPRQFKIQNPKFKINGRPVPAYTNGTRIWGYDLVKPTEDFSVAHFNRIAWTIIDRLWKRGKLPILVGGTGLYLKSLLHPPQSLYIPPNQQLRNELENLDINSLQKKLQHINSHRFKQMNHSDQHNPRRLIRAIEIATQIQKGVSLPARILLNRKDIDFHWIGLSAPLVDLDNRINNRVLARSRQGMTEEVKQLISRYSNWAYPAFSATGYTQWRAYLEGGLSREVAIEKWSTLERQYARRQLTWFKTQPEINWFDISKPTYLSEVVQTVKTWYALFRS